MEPLPIDDPRWSRRGFLGVAGGAGLLCSLSGSLDASTTPADVARADAAAAAAARPPGAQKPASTELTGFTTPQPRPGGRAREYWVEARSTVWNVVPTGKDEWMNRRIDGRRAYRALVYRLMSPGFARPLAAASIPGPILEAEVGDTLVVHFRNGDTRFDQALTIHPHGVRYNPEYDGSYLGEFTREGGFIAPGEEFTYTWQATPDSVGVWPYHDHGPNHTLNTFRGLYGALIVREKGAKRPDVEHVLFLGSVPPQITGQRRLFQTINQRSYAGNTPTIRAKAGQDVAVHVIGGDGNFHTWHVHGHRWKDAAGALTDCPVVGPNQTVTARWTEDNPGRWLYHCHVFTHQSAGMAGWYIVDP